MFLSLLKSNQIAARCPQRLRNFNPIEAQQRRRRHPSLVRCIPPSRTPTMAVLVAQRQRKIPRALWFLCHRIIAGKYSCFWGGVCSMYCIAVSPGQCNSSLFLCDTVHSSSGFIRYWRASVRWCVSLATCFCWRPLDSASCWACTVRSVPSDTASTRP